MGEEDDHPKDVETTEKKLKYPKHVFFILANEFCERFSYYGMRAILIIYLTDILKFTDNDATVIYHAFTMLCYFTPLFGAMLADSFLGKFKTIFYLSIIYAAGNIVLSLSSATDLKIPQVPFSLVGLVLISIGTGGIKPCVSAFGGDQFIIPEQEKQLASFFSIFYFSINSGSLISTFLTPIFRKDIKCFDEDSCYPLAFGVPAALMITSLVVFVVGRPWYRIRKPEGNVVVAVLRTIKYALGKKRKSSEKKEHWLDYAEGKYSRREIDEIKCLLRVLFLYLPLPFFWALFDQQGSRWTLQASRMDGELSSSFTLKPDQMQVVNPLLVLAFIPLFDKGIYPLLARCNIIKKPLQRLTMGGIFAGIAFVVSGVIELELQKTYPVEIGGSETHISIINMAGTDLTGTLIALDAKDKQDPLPVSVLHNETFTSGLLAAAKYSFEFEDPAVGHVNFTVVGQAGNATTILIYKDESASYQMIQPLHRDEYPPLAYDKDDVADEAIRQYDIIEKSDDGNPYVRVIQYGLWAKPANPFWNYDECEKQEFSETFDNCTLNFDTTVILREAKKQKEEDDEEFSFSPNSTFYSDWTSTETRDIEVHDYIIYIKTRQDGKMTQISEKLDLKLGGSYVIGIVPNGTDYTYTLGIITKPNSMHMLWLLPQYIIMTMGEIMFSITIMDFSYQEAPKSMKSVMQSAWLMTVAFGNLIVVIIAEAEIFDKQWKEFFLFAGLMFGDMIVFSYMAYIYVPADRLAQSAAPEILETNEKNDDGEIEDEKKRDGEDNPTFDKDD